MYEKVELWTCGRCGRDFFAVEPESPCCHFACFRLLDLVAPAPVAVGAFRIARPMSPRPQGQVTEKAYVANLIV